MNQRSRPTEFRMCAHQGCTNSYPDHKWGSIRAHDKGWFIGKDEKSYCPDHAPRWVTAWRQRLSRRIEQSPGSGGASQRGTQPDRCVTAAVNPETSDRGGHPPVGLHKCAAEDVICDCCDDCTEECDDGG